MTRTIRTAVAFTLIAGLSACNTDPASESSETAADSADVVAEATENVAEYFANDKQPLLIDPVADPGVLRGKTLMYLTAGLNSPGGSAGIRAFEEVQDVLGFDFVTFDGQFTISRYQEGLRQAVARGVDAVILVGIDCAGNESALREVREANIPVIGAYSVDCDEVDPDAESLFTAQVLYPVDGESARVAAVSRAYGAAQADYLISRLNGDVRAIQFDVPDFVSQAEVGKGFRDRLAECDTCELLESIPVGVADFGPNLQELAEQALLQHPDANAMAINYDDLVTLGISAAINGSGRQNDDLLVIAGGGQEAPLDLIRDEGGLDAGWVLGYSWDTYASIDTTMRVLAGQEPAVAGQPVVLYDRENNMPASGAFEPGTDFRAAFQTAWGLG